MPLNTPRILLRACLVPSLVACAYGQEAPDAQNLFFGPDPIEITVEPAAELWFEVRSRASSAEDVSEEDPLAGAISTTRAIRDILSDPAGWFLLDAHMLCASLPGGFAVEMDKEFRIPPKFRKAGIGPAPPLLLSMELALELDKAAPRWLEEVWPERQKALESTRAALAEILTNEAQHMMIAELENLVRLPAPNGSFPVRLVSTIPDRDEVVLGVRKQQVTAFVSTREREIPALADVVIHEVLHVSNSRPFFPASMFSVLVNKMAVLRVRGKKATDAIHLSFYMLSGELLRRYALPEHVDQGETSGFYGRAPGLHQQLKPLFDRFMSGEVAAGSFTEQYAAITAAWYAAGGEFQEQ